MLKEMTKLVLKQEPRRPGWYRVKRDWEIKIDGERITVPAGFVFDGDSVPRFPIVYLMAKARVGLKPTAVHDYLYDTREVSRARADRIFLRMMEETDVRWIWRRVHYAAVRAFGWIFY